jgi:copper transport protein
MQTIRSTFILVFVAMAASLSMLSGALAHAALVGSDPADGAVLPAAPPSPASCWPCCRWGPPGPAWSAPYALLLGAKLVLVALLFVLALWNRVALTRPALAGVEAAQGRLRRSIGIELLLVLVIFAVVAGWRFTPPPRVLAELEARPAQTHIHTSAAMADIAIKPGRSGESTMRIWLTDGEFAPISPRGVTVALSSAALGIERLKRPATLGADGFWQAPLTLPAGGAWSVEIDVRIDDFTLVKLTGEIELRP